MDRIGLDKREGGLIVERSRGEFLLWGNRGGERECCWRKKKRGWRIGMRAKAGLWDVLKRKGRR